MDNPIVIDTLGSYAADVPNYGAVYYTYTATADGNYVLTVNSNDYYVSYGTFSFDLLDSISSPKNSVTVALTAGQTLYIKVETYYGAAGTVNFSLEEKVDEPGDEPGDEPANVTGTFYGTDDFGNQLLTVVINDTTVVFTFDHPMFGPSSLTATYAIVDGAMVLYDDNGAVLNPLAGAITLTDGVPSVASYNGNNYTLSASQGGDEPGDEPADVTGTFYGTDYFGNQPLTVVIDDTTVVFTFDHPMMGSSSLTVTYAIVDGAMVLYNENGEELNLYAGAITLTNGVPSGAIYNGTDYTLSTTQGGGDEPGEEPADVTGTFYGTDDFGNQLLTVVIDDTTVVFTFDHPMMGSSSLTVTYAIVDGAMVLYDENGAVLYPFAGTITLTDGVPSGASYNGTNYTLSTTQGGGDEPGGEEPEVPEQVINTAVVGTNNFVVTQADLNAYGVKFSFEVTELGYYAFSLDVSIYDAAENYMSSGYLVPGVYTLNLYVDSWENTVDQELSLEITKTLYADLTAEQILNILYRSSASYVEDEYTLYIGSDWDTGALIITSETTSWVYTNYAITYTKNEDGTVSMLLALIEAEENNDVLAIAGKTLVVTFNEDGTYSMAWAASAHVHSWVDATCISPKTCSVCGETEGVALGHTWVEATEENDKYCSVCYLKEATELIIVANSTTGNMETSPICLEYTYTETGTADSPVYASYLLGNEGGVVTVLIEKGEAASCRGPVKGNPRIIGNNVVTFKADGKLITSVTVYVQGTLLETKPGSSAVANQGLFNLNKAISESRLVYDDTATLVWDVEIGDTNPHLTFTFAEPVAEFSFIAPNQFCYGSLSATYLEQGEAPHVHNWADATCTAPKTCLDCGATEGEALGHAWVDATCTAPKTCSVCGETEGEVADHAWVDATYYAPKTCSVCGATEGEALAAAAQIGEVKFGSFAEALDAAVDGDTVVLLADVDASDIVLINKAITIDGNDKTLNSSASRAINVECAGEVTVKNLTIACSASCERAINIINVAGTVNLEGVVTTTASYYAVHVATSAGAVQLNVADCELAAWGAICIYGEGSVVNVNNSNLSGNNTWANDHFATIAVGANNVEINVVGGKIVATSNEGCGYQFVIGANVGTSLNLKASLLCEAEYQVMMPLNVEFADNVQVTVLKQYADLLKAGGYHVVYSEDETAGTVSAHTYTAVETAPTCTAAGFTTYTCSCGDSYTEAGAAATGHAWVAATITAPKTCSVCGETEGEALEPTAENVLKAAYALSSGKALSGKWTLTGIITKVDTAYSSQYSNVTVTIVCDGLTDYPIQCYRMKGTGADVIGVYDTITVTGTIKNYNGTVEFDANCTLDSYTIHTCTEYDENHYCVVCGAPDPAYHVCSDTNGDFLCDSDTCDQIVPPAADSVLTLAQANALGKLYASGVYTENKYFVTGMLTIIENTTYGNANITDGSTTFYTYGMYNADGSSRYDAMSVKPVAYDTVTLYGKIGNYNGSAQMQNGWVVEHTVHVCSDWEDATCTAPKTCTVCGATEGESLGHTTDNGVCERCGETIDASQPSYVETNAELSFASKSNRTTFTTSQQVWEANGVILTNDKASSTSNVADYAGPARFYKSSKITVAMADGSQITKIAFTANSSSYATALKSSITSDANYTVTVSGSVVTVTFVEPVDSFVITSLTGGQVRMNSMTVTYLALQA